MYEALFTPSFSLTVPVLPPCKSMRSATASKRGGVLSGAATKRRRMRQSKRQAQVCEPVVISSNEDKFVIMEKDMKMLIFRYLSIAFVHYLSSPCIFSIYRFIIIIHFLLLQIYHHHAFSPSTEADQYVCGVFAIAFAMTICNRQRPELLCFEITKIRRHLQLLYNCLEDGLMLHFPASHRQRCHETTRTEMVKVFCKCRLQEEGKMICGAWNGTTAPVK